MNIVCLYPGAKRKAFTLSYDDGVMQDKRLVALFNQYGVKATFNLNSGKMTTADGWTHDSGIEIRHLNAADLPALYAGHEAAVHSVTHPHLEQLSEADITKELRDDRLAIETLFGSLVTGMAFPFGSWDERVLAIAAREGLQYARTTRHSYSFDTPDDFLTWDATCHHNYPGLLSLAREFTATEQELALFYVWGHSYEFDIQDNWDRMETLLQTVSGDDTCWYATNGQICRYLSALRELKVKGGAIVNPTDTPLWVEVDGEVRVITKE